MQSINIDPKLVEQANNQSHHDAGTSYLKDAQATFERFEATFPSNGEYHPEQMAYIVERREKWRGLVEEGYTDIIKRRSHFVPVTVAGPARYNGKKFDAMADRNLEVNAQWYEKFHNFIENTKERLHQLIPIEAFIEAIAKGKYLDEPVLSNDAHAVAKLEAKLAYYVKHHAEAKEINAYYRKHKTMQGHPDFTDEQASRTDANIENGFSWERQPFPKYHISNNNKKIKAIQARIEELTQIKETTQEANVKVPNAEVEMNKEDMRIQIFFDYKPNEDERSILKTNGFKWAPSKKAWQRQLNANGMRALERVAEALS